MSTATSMRSGVVSGPVEESRNQPTVLYPAPPRCDAGPSVERYHLPLTPKRELWAGDDDPQEYHFTIDDFHRVCDLGLFDHCKVELINGRIFVSPMPSHIHWFVVHRVRRWAEKAFSEGAFTVRSESGLHCSDDSELGPDVHVVAGTDVDLLRLAAHPRNGVLIVEVSQHSHQRDHGIKMRRYAATGTPEYWVIDLLSRSATVYRQPVPAIESDSGYTYATSQTVAESASLSLLNGAEPVKLCDLLPPTDLELP